MRLLDKWQERKTNEQENKGEKEKEEDRKKRDVINERVSK